MKTRYCVSALGTAVAQPKTVFLRLRKLSGTSDVQHDAGYRAVAEVEFCKRAVTLMLTRYGDRALEHSYLRVDELTAAGDYDGADTWRRISAAVVLASTTPPGGVFH